jgi:cell division protein FtsW
MQVLWCSVGLAACGILALFDYKWLKKMAWPVFGGTLLLAALVFVPHIGIRLNGAHRWIGKFGFSFQPSEVVKIGLIIALAWYMDFSQRKMGTFKRGIVIPGLIIGAALGLIFFEPDRGTSILLAGVSGVMLYVAGARWPHLILAALVGVGLLAMSLRHDSMRNNRLEAWRHPEAHANGVARQAEQSKIAIGSGGLLGQGLGDGVQKRGFVSEIQSDFIFANIGEELGFAATAPVVLAYLLIGICGIYIGLHARDQFGAQLAIGITSLICFQAVINIGVVTSLLPNKGLALPFISSGGSSLLAMLIGVGILLSVARQAVPGKISETVLAEDDNPFAKKGK